MKLCSGDNHYTTVSHIYYTTTPKPHRLFTRLSLFQRNYKMTAIDLSKQQALDTDSKAIQQINFTGNLDEEPTIFFIIPEAKETTLDISQRNVKAL